MRREEQGLEAILWAARRIIRYRKGHEPVGRVQDALDALGFETRTGLKPLLCHEHKTDYGWHLVWHLPPGISSREIVQKAHYFKEQAGGEIEFRLLGQKLHMDLCLTPLPKNVPYERKPQGYPGMKLPVPLGVTQQGPLVVEIADKPHVLIGGNTGCGKTTLLRHLVVSLLLAGAQVIVVDLKGGLDFACFRRHCTLITDTQGAVEMMDALYGETKRRIPVLEKAMVTSLVEYPGDDLPFIVFVIDELARLDGREAQQKLNRLVSLSRSTGIAVVAATQRPSASLFQSTQFSNTRMLFAGRLSFWVPKPEDSRMVLEDEAAADLPADIPGRAIWQWDRQRQVQCYNLSLQGARDLLETIPEGRGLFGEHRGKRLPPRPEDIAAPGPLGGAHYRAGEAPVL
ncbi:MAG TPA: DUF853 family protein [Firmicutes bacterium]|nr:DUF853 family protein [Candidatus Fermentithermobacillaceae bacterium]